MHQFLNDPIDVIVEFSNNKPIPRKIRWGNKIYYIDKLNLIHTAQEGIKKIYYFSVSNHVNFMKLRLDSETLEWRLVELYTD